MNILAQQSLGLEGQRNIGTFATEFAVEACIPHVGQAIPRAHTDIGSSVVLQGVKVYACLGRHFNLILYCLWKTPVQLLGAQRSCSP